MQLNPDPNIVILFVVVPPIGYKVDFVYTRFCPLLPHPFNNITELLSVYAFKLKYMS